MSLQQSVAFAVVGSMLTILAPIVGMSLVPGALAVLLVGLIIRIGGHLVFLPLIFSGFLARRGSTKALRLDSRIGYKLTPTVGTVELAVHGFLLREAVDLNNGLFQEE
jgi:hypothetical protein